MLNLVGLEEITSVIHSHLIIAVNQRWVMIMVHHAIVFGCCGSAAIVVEQRVVWSIEILFVTVDTKGIGLCIAFALFAFAVGRSFCERGRIASLLEELALMRMLFLVIMIWRF